jgi:competence protein ComEC
LGNKTPSLRNEARQRAGWEPAVAGMVGGVALQLQQASLNAASLYAGIALAGSLLVVSTLLMRPGAPQASRNLLPAALAVLALTLAGALAGFGLTGWRATAFQASSLSAALEGRDIEVAGLVTAMPQRSEDALRFRFRVESARLGGEPVVLPPEILLGWYATFGGREPPAAQGTEKGDDPSELALTPRQPQNMRAGERWQMTVRLKAPHGNSNPHGFDYELWLWEQGLQATGYVRAGMKDPAPARLSQGWRFPVERARQAAREAIYAQVGNRQLAGIVAALVVGDQNAIERADWDVFRATGVAHLMSISGLHITMFAWVAALLVGGLWRRSARFTPRLCLSLPAVTAGAMGGLLLSTGYALFSGWGVPAQRTVCMLAAVTMLRLGGRKWPWHATWLAAMGVVLLADPWAIWQAGFWLSFVAVGVLFAVGTPDAAANQPGGAINSGATHARFDWAKDRFGIKKWPETAFLVNPIARASSALASAAREQWIVTLALTPLSLLLFNQVSVVGLVANAIAIPWVTLVVTPLAMLGLLWAPIWNAAAWGLGLLSVLLQWLASFPWASISIASAPLAFAVAGVTGGALLALRLPWHWRLLGVPLLLPVLLWQMPRPPVGQFELLAADIGQGNAVLVRTRSHALLYDTGPRFSRESDAGHRVLVPLLRALGESLDTLILSHRDADHIGGAPAVLAMQPQAALLASIEDSHELQSLRKAARCVAGQHWEWDGVMFDILHPQAADYDALNKSNAMSCVLRISNGRQTALLTGDIEAEQETRLVAGESAASLRADVLLVPHHGSKTSSTARLLDAVQPRIALAQAGYRNRFGHPVAQVVARYDERGIRLVKSPQCGASTWRSARPDDITCQRIEGKRYWHHDMPP